MKQYKVLGDRDVLGHKPGDVFSEKIPEAQEKRLVGRGQLEVLGGATPKEASEPQAPGEGPSEETSEPSVMGRLFGNSPIESQE